MPRAGWKKKSDLSTNRAPDAGALTAASEAAPAVMTQREALIQEKQAQLGTLYERHDDLVRLSICLRWPTSHLYCLADS